MEIVIEALYSDPKNREKKPRCIRSVDCKSRNITAYAFAKLHQKEYELHDVCLSCHFCGCLEVFDMNDGSANDKE